MLQLRQRLRLLSLCCMLGLALAAPARGQGADVVFTVADVPVDATADSPAAARDKARQEGQRRAFRTLLERLTLAADYPRLPTVPDAALTAMVQDFSVANERSSAVRYLADYTFRFRPGEVRQVLRRAGVPYTETPSKPLVVLPLFERGNTRVLWDDPNPWREAWANLQRRSTLVPVIVPLGELGDVAAIDADRAAAADAAALAAIADRHGDADVLVARAAERAGRGFEVAITRHGAFRQAATTVGTFAAAAGEGEAEVLTKAASATVERLEQDWKRSTIVRSDREQRISVRVPFGSLADWVAIRERLGAVPAIQRTDIVVLGRREAQLDLTYLGEPEQLRTALAQRNLTLDEAGGGWTLRRTGAR